MVKKIHATLARIGSSIWFLFISGLLTILPLMLTVALFSFTFGLLSRWLAPLQAFEPEFLKIIPFSSIIVAVVLIFLLGLIVKLFVLDSLIHTIEHLIFKIPLLRPIYSGFKQLVKAFNPHDDLTFKKVVFVEFPRPGIYSLGFLTSELATEFTPDIKEKYFNVFVPTTPNPTSGFFFMVAESNIKLSSLTRQEAMALIISGGIIQPERQEIEN